MVGRNLLNTTQALWFIPFCTTDFSTSSWWLPYVGICSTPQRTNWRIRPTAGAVGRRRKLIWCIRIRHQPGVFFLKKPWSFLWIDSGWNCGISIFHLNVICINGLQSLKMIKTHHIVWFPIPSEVAKTWIWDDSNHKAFAPRSLGNLSHFGVETSQFSSLWCCKH